MAVEGCEAFFILYHRVAILGELSSQFVQCLQINGLFDRCKSGVTMFHWPISKFDYSRRMLVPMFPSRELAAASNPPNLHTPSSSRPFQAPQSCDCYILYTLVDHDFQPRLQRQDNRHRSRPSPARLHQGQIWSVTEPATKQALLLIVPHTQLT